MSLPALLRRHLPTVAEGLRTLKNHQFEIAPPRRTFAPTELHAFIKSRFGNSSGIFLEAGANDGLTQSNTAYLERYCGWRGILVEAIPHKFVECRRNRPNARTFHAALVAEGHEADFVPLRYSNLMSVAENASDTDVEAHLSTGEAFLRDEGALSGETFLAPARTASEIIRASGFNRIDLFSLDVEGAEMEVLNGVDFASLRPRNFIIEARDPLRVSSFLEARGYSCERQLTHHDYLFVDTATGTG